MITLEEISRWTGITEFECLLHVLAVLVSSVLIVLRWDFAITITYWQIFTPLFIASGLNIYFVFIVTLRFFLEEKQMKRAIFQNAFNFLRALAVGIFEMLICQKIEGDFERGQVALETTYAIIFTPIWILMLALGVLACKVGNN